MHYQLRGAEQFFARPEVRNAMTLLRNSANAQTDEKTPQLVRDVLKSLGYSDQAPASSGAVRAKWESLAALVSMADSLNATREKERAQARENNASELPQVFSLHEFVAHLAQRLQNQDAPSMDGVTLASLHSAKGLEWDAVYLCGLNEGLMPISFAKTSDEIDEERRLLYVGITRARKYITFSWSLSRTPGGRANRKRSRFLDTLAPKNMYR